MGTFIPGNESSDYAWRRFSDGLLCEAEGELCLVASLFHLPCGFYLSQPSAFLPKQRSVYIGQALSKTAVETAVRLSLPCYMLGKAHPIDLVRAGKMLHVLKTSMKFLMLCLPSF